MSFRFLHIGDLHLGAKQFQNIELVNDYIQILKVILNIAEKKHVNAVLFAGDVFTSLEILLGIFHQILTILEKFYSETSHKIQLIAIEGNHDIRRNAHGTQHLRRQSCI
ncbi:MAG: metallophosphoesterase [Promethearchaeota archaeon]